MPERKHFISPSYVTSGILNMNLGSTPIEVNIWAQGTLPVKG